jgi:hypothetical protein
MPMDKPVTYAGLRTPRAAALAGIIFSILLFVVFWLLRRALPADPVEPGVWLATSRMTVAVALNLVPFAGVAFLWFLGALRDRMGQQEDRFFATVFFGSGLLFLATLFAAAAILGALVLSYAAYPDVLANSSTLYFARAVTYVIMNVYAIKMAAVFMISTSTVVIYTGIAPSWVAVLGYTLALILLFGSYLISWSFMVLPIWVCLISLYILIDNFRKNGSQGRFQKPEGAS